jgi:hypothetical protein
MKPHWLTRPATIRRLWILFIAVLAATVLAELLIHRHPVIGIDGLFGFNAWYGFGACVALVLAARLLGFALKRRDGYYGS